MHGLFSPAVRAARVPCLRLCHESYRRGREMIGQSSGQQGVAAGTPARAARARPVPHFAPRQGTTDMWTWEDHPLALEPDPAGGPGGHCRRHHRDVLGERRHHRPVPGRRYEIRGGQAHPLEQHQCRLDHGLLRTRPAADGITGAMSWSVMAASLEGDRGTSMPAGRTRRRVQAVPVLGRNHQFSCPRGDLNDHGNWALAYTRDR
jgi:hypothetical protein